MANGARQKCLCPDWAGKGENDEDEKTMIALSCLEKRLLET